MEATLDRIKTARDAGYSDDEIYAHLGSKDARFSKAQEAGYTLDEVGSFLSRKEPVQSDASFRNSPDAPPAPISDAPYRQIRQELKDEEKSQPLSDMVMRAVAGTAKAGLQTAAGVLNLADYTPQMQVNKLMGSDTLDREVKSFIRDAADRTDESYYVEKNFDKKLASEIIGAGTSLVPIIASGPGGVAGQVIAGAALAGESARKEAEVGGADELQQQKAFLVNAAVGAATEKLLGLPATLRSITAAARNTAVKGAAREIAQETLKGFGREGTQEVFQEVSKDLEAKFISAYDPERNAFDTKKLTKTFLIGGLLGGVVGGGGRAAVEIQGAIDARATEKAETEITENLPEAALDAGTGPIDASLESIAQATPPPFPSTPPPLPVKAEEAPVAPPAQEAPKTEIPRLSTIQIDAEGNPVKDDQGKYVQVYADTGEVVETRKQGVPEPQANPAQEGEVTPEPAEAFKPFMAQAVEAAKAAGAIDPEAAAQEAWVDVSRQVTEGKSNLDNPKALLTLAAKRKAFEQVKAEEAQKRGGGKVGSLNEPDLSGRTVEETQGTPIGPRAETIAEEDATRIQAKLDSLPPLQAASIRGMAEGLSDAEIAAQNNTSEGAVKQARLRGRKAMRAFIQKEGIGQSMGPGAAASSEVLAKFEEKAFGKRLSEDEALNPELREDLSSGYYEIPNRVTVDQANELIDTVPEKQLLRLVTDEDSGASYADRVTVGLVMMRKLNERFKSQKQTDPEAARETLQDAIDMGEASSELGLRLGQGVQSFAIWNKLSPEGKLIATQRAVKKARNRHKKDNKTEIEEITSAVNQVNAETASKVANSKKVKAAIKGAEPEQEAKGVKEPEERRPAALDKSVWGQYENSAIKNLESALFGKASQPPPIQDFTTRLVSALRSKLPQKERTSSKLTDEQIIREAITNFDKYQQVWQDTANSLKLKYGDNPNVLMKLDEIFGPAFKEPFSRQTVRNLISKKLKEDEIKLSSLIEKHYSNTERAGRDLAEKISTSLGIPAEQAAKVAAAVEQEFAVMATQKKAQALAALLKSGNKIIKKTGTEKIIAASNKGALTDQTFYDAVSESLGLPTFNPDHAAKIMHLAELAEQAPEGMPKEDAEFELNKYIASIKGFKASDLLIGVYYGNILSGTGTQAVNLFDTALNVISEVNTLALSDPKAASTMMSGLIRGLDNGRFDAVVALTKGRRISDGKFVDTPYLMEVAQFGKEGVPINVTGKASALTKAFAEKASYLNAYKYVQRAMSASDSLMFRSAQEAKASQIAFDMAYNSGLRGEALSSEIDRILALDRAEEFLAQAEREGYTGSTARARATELMIMARPEGLNKDSTEFASESTYNYKPYGLAGSISASIEKFAIERPVLKAFVVPFTRIVANIVNRGLNNSPYGYIRAFKGRSGTHVFTDQQRQAMLVRANVAVAALSTLGVLHALGIIAINGQGPNDPEKRKQLRETGWKPYSIKIGDTYLSYSMLPVGMSLAVMGNFFDGQKYNELGQKDGIQRVQYAFTSILSTIFSQSFLSGLTPIFDAISGKNPGGSISAGNRIVSQTATGVAIPFASLVKDVNQFFDPSLRKPKNFLQALISEIPFARTALRPSVNALGEKIDIGRFRALNRFGSRQKDDKAWKLVADKNLRVPVPGPFFTEPEKDYEYNQTVGKKIKAWLERNESYLRGKTTTEAQESLDGFSDKTRKEVRQAILFQGGKKKLKKGEVPKTSAVDLMYSGK